MLPPSLPKARAVNCSIPGGTGTVRIFCNALFGRLDTEKGWTKQLHVEAIRNANTRRTRELGANTGFEQHWRLAAGSKSLALIGPIRAGERAYPKL